ncbi:MAG: hypothetical protein ABFD60_02990, partial [Bryobacteraceae bacterium]
QENPIIAGVRRKAVQTKIPSLIIMLALATGSAVQAASDQYWGDSYLFFSVDKLDEATIADFFTFGGGADALIYKGLGVNVDLGYQFVRNDFASGVGLTSFDGCYHFVNRAKPAKLVPYVVAGYAIAFRSGHVNLFNYGAGVNYWFSRHVGFRGEIRDYRAHRYDWGVGFRLGLAFR